MPFIVELLMSAPVALAFMVSFSLYMKNVSCTISPMGGGIMPPNPRDSGRATPNVLEEVKRS
jgi:hypothetical protein